jgi:hypothetical protein
LSSNGLVDWSVKLGLFLPVGDLKSNGKRKRVMVDSLVVVLKAADEPELQQLIESNYDSNWRVINIPHQVS